MMSIVLLEQRTSHADLVGGPVLVGEVVFEDHPARFTVTAYLNDTETTGNFTLFVEFEQFFTPSTWESYGRESQTAARVAGTIGRRVEFDHVYFIPAGYRARFYLQSGEAGDDDCTVTLFVIDAQGPSIVFDEAIDGLTVRAALRAMAAMLCGKCSGAGTGEETFRSVDDDADRVVVDVDDVGNRTSVTIS